MIRNYRPVLLFFCALIAACNDSSTKPVSPSPTPSLKESAKPVPDVSKMIRRMTTQDDSKDFTSEMRMTAEAADGKRDQIEFRLQRKNNADGASTFLTVLSPKEESNKAILAFEKNDKPTEAFSYLAGLKKLAKLDSARQLSFRGARVTVQELLGMELDKYTHNAGEWAAGEWAAGKRAAGQGEPLIKVEFKAKPDMGLAFPRIVGYFRESDQTPVRFDLFGDNGEVTKKVAIEEVKIIQNHLTITRVAIEDLAQKLKLKLETRKVEYDHGLSDKIFTEDYLKNFITGASQRLDERK